MHLGGWRSVEMILRYTAKATARHRGAAKMAACRDAAETIDAGKSGIGPFLRPGVAVGLGQAEQPG